MPHLRLRSLGLAVALGSVLTACGAYTGSPPAPAAATKPTSVPTQASPRPPVAPGQEALVASPPGPAANQALHVTITRVTRVTLPSPARAPAGGVPIALTLTLTNPTARTLDVGSLDFGAGAATAAHNPAGAIYCAADDVANSTWRPPGHSLFALSAGSSPLLVLQYPMNGYLLAIPGRGHATGTITLFASGRARNALWVMDNCGPVTTPLVRVPFTVP
jgi:hypothetical protein